MYEPRPFQVLLIAVVICLVLQACSAFRVPDEPPRPTPVTPVWNAQSLYEHIRFLNREDVRGRATGTQAYARAAAYVSSRMAEYGLQPAIQGDFRSIYSAPINYPLGGRLRAIGTADSLVFVPGIHFLADGRSDSGSVDVTRFIVATGDTPPAAMLERPFGILVPPNESVDLAAWRAAGAALVVLIGPLRPRFGVEPLDGLVVVQMTPNAARRLLRPGDEPLDPYLAGRHGEGIFLGRVLRAHVLTSYQPQAGAINMLGYFSGKHPIRRHQLVIVCSDLDALGQYAGVSVMDFRSFGTATAALLEITRNVGFVTQRWQVPDRSIMVAIWSGSRVGHVGLRTFLENATWPVSRIHSVVYVGLSDSERPQVQALLDRYGVRLAAIPPPDEPLYPEDVLLLPDGELRRAARDIDQNVETPEAPDMSQLIDSAVVRARDLAGRSYERLMIEVTHPDPFMPVDKGILQAPAVDANP